MLKFYEFFCGGGMARLGLGEGWRCLFANDFDVEKARIYKAYFKDDALLTRDVATLTASDLPGRADMAWASFPCQDLSLAGAGAGLKGERSGTFWHFMRLLEGLAAQGRMPSVVALENVVGTLHANGGKDFAAIIAALADLGLRVGAMVIDAALFVPQSRPRLFVIGAREPPPSLTRDDPSALWHPAALVRAFHGLDARLAQAWVWWDMPAPPPRVMTFSDVVMDEPTDVGWHTPFETKKLLDMMSPANRLKVEQAKAYARASGRRVVGAIYKRTRRDGSGAKVQRAEVRFDDIAGCLRTPAGGSSRQIILVVEPGRVRSRLLSSREAARLMGMPDDYPLPTRYNAAYHLVGDGVAVPVVGHLARHVLEPQCRAAASLRKTA